ncbi:MAG: hypothetical protein ABIL09_08785 [Gemmatimonadota bacterium]
MSVPHRAAPLVVAASLALAVGAASCADRITSTETVFDRQEPVQTEPGTTATYAFVQEQVLTPSCALSGCHGGAQFPDLSAASAYGSIVGQESSSGMPLVDPGAPRNSFLYIKINGGPNLEGRRMPYQRQPLPQALIDSVGAWIERGARRDG